MRTVIFDVFYSFEEGYSLQFQQTCYAESNRIVLQCEAEDEPVVQEALEQIDAVREAVHYDLWAVFSNLHTLMVNNQLHALEGQMQVDCVDVTKCLLETLRHWLSFGKLL